MEGSLRVWSRAVSSACRFAGACSAVWGSGMMSASDEQAVVYVEVERRPGKPRQRRGAGLAHQLAHRVKGGDEVLLSDQLEGGFHLGFGGGGGQVEHPHILPIGPGGRRVLQG